jgi:hypothetical protein
VVECIARAAEAVDAVRAGKHGSESEEGEDEDEDEEGDLGDEKAASHFSRRACTREVGTRLLPVSAEVDADDPIPLGYLLVL